MTKPVLYTILRGPPQSLSSSLNTLRPRQNDHHIPDDIFENIFLDENIWISIKILLKVVPKRPLENKSALGWVIAPWHQTGDKAECEPMLT